MRGFQPLLQSSLFSFLCRSIWSFQGAANRRPQAHGHRPLMLSTYNQPPQNADDNSTIFATMDQTELRAQAEKLRERAKKLRQEASAEEALLKESRSGIRRERMRESDNRIDHLFPNKGLVPVNSTLSAALERQIAGILRTERWSPQQVMMVLERLQERQFRVQGAANQTEWNVLDGWISSLINAANSLDDEYKDSEQQFTLVENSNARWNGRVAPALRKRRKDMIRAQEEEFKRKIGANVNKVVRSSKPPSENGAVVSAKTVPEDILDYTRKSTVGIPSDRDGSDANASGGKRPTNTNVTRIGMERAVPVWVPASLLPHLVESRATVSVEDVNTIKDRVLVGCRFFCTSYDTIPTAAIFRGNIRMPVGVVNVAAASKKGQNSNFSAVVLEEIQRRLEAQGVAERVQVFWMEDPEWRPGKDSSAPVALPVLLAISSKVEPTGSTMEYVTTSLVAKRILAALTALSTLSLAVSCHALNPSFFDFVVNQKKSTKLFTCIPLFLGVVSVQVVHEAAHCLAAKIRNIRIGRPTPVPSAQVGIFGCITPVLSFPSNRTALFDLAFSGPVAAMVLSLVMMVAGAYATINASESALSNFPVVSVGMFKCSLLTSVLLSVTAPKLMLLPLAQPVPFHPLFLSGFMGLVSSALNLLPVFRLDGGRLITTLFGSRIAGVSSASVLLFMLSLVISGTSGVALSWGLWIVFFQRRTEVPVRDDVTPVDDARFGAWMGAIAAAILTLCPYPGGPGFL